MRTALLAAISILACVVAHADDERPNIVLIIADDLGIADLGVNGSEIHTPNLDRLAREGGRFTSFYGAPNCSPTRAMLLSGADHHEVGLGTMAEMRAPEVSQAPGYEGHLNERAVTVAQRLHDAGYFTAIAGKWHLGSAEPQLPHRRGFDRSFVLLEGGASHFADGAGMTPAHPRANYRRDGKPVEPLPGFFSTRSYTDLAIEYIDESRRRDKPAFLYVAYTAPHWPLQVESEWLDRYHGQYDAGYEVIAQRRLDRRKSLGQVPAHTTLAPLPAAVRPWSALHSDERRMEARKMEVYAAMVENLDHHIGRLIAHLQHTGMLDNTVVVFLSDNGPEGADMSMSPIAADWVRETFDNSLQNVGRPRSYVAYGQGWASASAAPAGLAKSFPTDGGVRVPAFVWMSSRKLRPIIDEPVSVMDIAPTLLDLAGIHAPAHSSMHTVGSSVARLMVEPDPRFDQRAIHLELFGRRGVRLGDWKATLLFAPYGTGQWRLFNVMNDPAETTDIAADHPARLHELISGWDAYARRSGVIVLDRDAGYGQPAPAR